MGTKLVNFKQNWN